MIIKMHHSGQELTFEDIDIKTIFQPVEHSLDIIKDLFCCDFNTEAKISQDLAITPNTSIRKKSYEKNISQLTSLKQIQLSTKILSSLEILLSV